MKVVAKVKSVDRKCAKHPLSHDELMVDAEARCRDGLLHLRVNQRWFQGDFVMEQFATGARIPYCEWKPSLKVSYSEMRKFLVIMDYSASRDGPRPRWLRGKLLRLGEKYMVDGRQVVENPTWKRSSVEVEDIVVKMDPDEEARLIQDDAVPVLPRYLEARQGGWDIATGGALRPMKAERPSEVVNPLSPEPPKRSPKDPRVKKSKRRREDTENIPPKEVHVQRQRSTRQEEESLDAWQEPKRVQVKSASKMSSITAEPVAGPSIDSPGESSPWGTVASIRGVLQFVEVVVPPIQVPVREDRVSLSSDRARQALMELINSVRVPIMLRDLRMRAQCSGCAGRLLEVTLEGLRHHLVEQHGLSEGSAGLMALQSLPGAKVLPAE